MNTEQTQVIEPTESTESLSESSDPLGGWAIAFWVGGLLAGIIGLWQLFNESKLVGGDAYNYMIGATRGVGWICLGLLLGILGCALLLFSIRQRVRVHGGG